MSTVDQKETDHLTRMSVSKQEKVTHSQSISVGGREEKEKRESRIGTTMRTIGVEGIRRFKIELQIPSIKSRQTDRQIEIDGETINKKRKREHSYKLWMTCLR